MKRRGMLWHQGSAALLLAAGAVWLSGCGGAGGPTWSNSGPSYSNSGSVGAGGLSGGAGTRSAPQPAGVVLGVVEMPVKPTGYGRPIARMDWLRVGSPVYAEATTARMPLVGAQVHLIDRSTRESVSATVNTNTKGEFRIENVTPSSRFSVLASDGKNTLEAVVPAIDAAGKEVRVTVNEATTVGAAAARLADAEGVGPEGCLAVAAEIADLQQSYQAEKPAELPDLTRTDEAKECARKHLLRTADKAVSATVDTTARSDAWRGVASAQLLARTSFKLSRKLVLQPEQAEAMVAAMTNKDTRTVTAEKVVAALHKAGVKAKGGKAVAAADVSAALDSLRKSLPCLKETKEEKLPVLAALLLAEQSEAPFQITTREQMKGYLKDLVGEASAAPKPSKGKPAAGAKSA